MTPSSRTFVGKPLVPAGPGFVTSADGSRPPVPRAFQWENRTLAISAVVRAWRSTKADRGDTYLKRHWFELETECGLSIEVYYDREARGKSARWWLYTASHVKP